MSRKLNLGCGTYPFPFERGKEPARIINHSIPFPETVYEPGWINVDKFPMPGVDECINLWRFPWIRSSNGSPFNDDSFDEVWCSHIIEHIPHEVKVARELPGALYREYAQMVEDFDGFFVFFKEVYRLLKPDGLIYLRFPYAVNYPALCDPTHNRPIVMGTLGYLKAQNGDDPFDYNVGIHFEIEEHYSMRFTERGEYESRHLNEKGIARLMRDDYNTIEDIQVVLRAVKG